MTIARIDFRSSGSAASPWNTATSPAVGVSIANLIDDTAASTGWGLTLGGTAPAAEALGVNSVGSGDAAWVDAALTSQTEWTYNGITGTLVFTGLNNSYTYDLELYSSRAATGDRTLEASTDNFSTVSSINGANNTTQILTLAAVSPSAGNITLSIREGSTAIAAYLSALRITENAGGDVTAPVLTSPTGTTTGSTTGSGTVTTDEGNGALYYYASINASETAATIKASGSSQAVSGTGSQGVSFTGLTASTAYYAHYVHDDSSANESNVVSSTPAFTTDAAVNNDPVLDTPAPDVVISTSSTAPIYFGYRFSDADSDTLTFSISPDINLLTGWSWNSIAGIAIPDGTQEEATAVAYTITADDGGGGTLPTDVVNITVTAAASTLTAVSITAAPIYAGDIIRIVLSDSPGSAGYVVTIPEGTLTVDDEAAGYVDIVAPNLKTFGDLTGDYSTNITITVSLSGESDTIVFQVAPDVGDEVGAIAAVDGIYAEPEFSGVAVTDLYYTATISGADFTVGAVPVLANTQVLDLWIKDQTDGTWGDPFEVTIPGSAGEAATLIHKLAVSLSISL